MSNGPSQILCSEGKDVGSYVGSNAICKQGHGEALSAALHLFHYEQVASNTAHLASVVHILGLDVVIVFSLFPP